ncbi:hypothetical protein [Variovorax paradoxus]|uniref:hypothetical protein n=1 Tax=Variovorax paradoxus TaxID=34073 RepID=UPI003D64ECD8
MTQAIDPVKLKAAAEHLEWVLQQYPGVSDVSHLYDALRPLIEDAKNGRVSRPIDRQEMPCRYLKSEGVYRPYENPDVEGAYVCFSIEMEGGLTEEDREINSIIEGIRKATKRDHKS